MKTRRAAREWALRILYAHEMSQNPVAQCSADILAGGREDSNMLFCRELIARVADKDELIDDLIARAVEKWDLKRIAVIDHIVLRIGIAEFLYFDDIPFKVTINECIELAKRYSTGQSGRFVNGILDAISHDVQKRVRKSADLSARVGTA